MSQVRMGRTRSSQGLRQSQQEGITTKNKKRQVRRHLTYDNVSYFDAHNNHDHNDEDPPSMNPPGGRRSSRKLNESRTRHHYHVRTRLSKRRARSSYRTKHRSIRGGSTRKSSWTKQEHLQRKIRKIWSFYIWF